MDGHLWYAWNLHPWCGEGYNIVRGIECYTITLCNNCLDDIKTNPDHEAWSVDWSWDIRLVIGWDKFESYEERRIQLYDKEECCHEQSKEVK